jgi:HAD superfamily hydrolase (TIGR01509 family)
MAEFDAVLFDFDGVLADTEPLHYECWRDIVRPFGIELDWETYQRIGIGFTDRALVMALCRLAVPEVEFARLWDEYPRKRALFRERVLRAGVISEEVRQLLNSLDGLGIAVVTSSSRDEVEPVMIAAGVRPLIDVLICREDVTAHKPAAEPYLRAAEALGSRHPLVVEDSDAGAASGQAAGFAVLRVTECRRMPEQVRDRLRI